MRHPPPLSDPSSRSGMTMIEVMAALMVLTVAAQMLLSALTASVRYRAAREERALAVQAAINVIEAMHAAEFYDVFASFNQSADDDPDGPGTAHGATFQIDGLDPLPGARWTGEVLLPEKNGQLVESLEMEALGMPRDLNGDFAITAEGRVGDYLILPVAVTVRWQSGTGAQSFTMSTLLADVEKEKGDR